MGEQVHRDTATEVGQLRQLVAPEVTIEEYAMDEQCYRSSPLFQITDVSGWSLNLFSFCGWFVPFHELTSLCRCGSVGFPKSLSAILTADLDCFSADLDLDGIRVELAIAGCASFFRHDFSPISKFG
jgi:hypothetical protein